jgi:hypothetical protein
MSISRWAGLVVICVALGGAASGTLAGGLTPPAGPGTGPPTGPSTVPNIAPPPFSDLVITQFTASSMFGTIWTFAGQVTGGNGSAVTINFGNLPTLVGKTTPVGNDGSFIFTIELTEDDYGLATAQAVNTGQQSNVAEAYIFP